jgi:hypothetical protein
VYFAVVGFDKKKKKIRTKWQRFLCKSATKGGQAGFGWVGQEREEARESQTTEREREGRARDNEKTHYK